MKKIEKMSLEELQKEVEKVVIVQLKEVFELKKVQNNFKESAAKKITRLVMLKSKNMFENFMGSEKEMEKEVEKLEKNFAETYKSLPKEEQATYRFFKFEFASKKAADEFEESLKGNKEVVSVEREQVFTIEAYPNDPNFTLNTTNLWGLHKIKANNAWDCTKGCDSVVAVIDTGVDYNHLDLNHNMYEIIPNVYGINAITSTVAIMDTQGHGTHVSGTIAAEGNNLHGVLGVAPRSRLVGIKAFFGTASTTSILANAFNWVSWLKTFYINNLNIINNSWGPQSPIANIPSINAQITNCTANGIINVFSAGNNPPDDAGSYYPQNDPRVLTVGATDPSDNRASFSKHGSVVNVAAPGVNILSTVPGGGFGILSGTSMAAPHVTGMVALIRSKYPNLDFATVRNIIETYVDTITPDKYIGSGRISLEYLEEILCGCGCSPCKMNEIIQHRQLENKRKKKFKVIPGAACGGNNQEECMEVRVDNFQPCFSLYWADSALDNIETHDTEICYLRVCNNYRNLAFKGLEISEIVITPNQVLPNGDQSVRMVPEELICFDNLGPCSCATREVSLLTRSAAPGNYTIHIKYCIEDIAILGRGSFLDKIPITLVNS